MMSRRTLSIPLLLTVGLGVAACGSEDEPGSASERPQVVTAVYPLAWAVERLGGDAVDVVDLTPPGTEPHDLELAPTQVEAIGAADLVIVLGRGFQPAVEEAAAERDGATLAVLDALGIGADGDTVEAHEHGDEHADEHGHEHADEHGAIDPHVWLDPVLMVDVVDAIAEQLAPLVDADVLATARTALIADLEQVDADFSAGLASCEQRQIVTSHDAFGRLATRYDLETVPIAGLSPDAEPSPDRLAELADLVEESGVTTIFAETLVSPEIAETLADEAGGLEVAVLNPIEGRTPDEIDAGVDFLDLLRADLAALQAGLGCTSAP